MKLFEHKERSNGTAWKLFGGAALAAFTVALIYNMPDIKRLIKIHTM